jgi:hypothetical protein
MPDSVSVKNRYTVGFLVHRSLHLHGTHWRSAGKQTKLPSGSQSGGSVKQIVSHSSAAQCYELYLPDPISLELPISFLYPLDRLREEREPKFRLARPFIPVLQLASRCYMLCYAFRLELAIRRRHSAAEFLHLSPRTKDKNGMRKFGSLSSLDRLQFFLRQQTIILQYALFSNKWSS